MRKAMLGVIGGVAIGGVLSAVAASNFNAFLDSTDQSNSRQVSPRLSLASGFGT